MTDRAAFDAKLTGCLPFLTIYALQLTRDQGAAEDLVQQTALRALSAWRQFQPGTNAQSWLGTIMHNLHTDACRKRGRDAKRYGMLLLCSPSSQPPNQIDAIMLREALALLAGLPSSVRGMVTQASLDGDSYDTIAARHGLPKGTIKSRISRARQSMQALA